MTDSPLRLACIGSFGHTENILQDFRDASLPHQLIAWAPAYPEEDGLVFRDSLSRHYGQIPSFSDHHSLLAQARPHWVIVSTRLDLIAPISSDALRAGAHVIAEKPLALTLDSLAALESAWRSSQRHLSAMLTMEKEPAFIAARDAFRAGRLGRLLLADARKSYKWGARPAWFADSSLYGGTLPWIGIHALDMIHFTTGLHFTGGFAFHANLAHPSHPACQDSCVASLSTDAGAFVNVSVDLARPGSAPTWGDDWCRLVGSSGILEANASQGWCRLLGPDGRMEEIPLPPRHHRFAAIVRRVQAGDLAMDQSLSSLHLTSVSLHLRDAAMCGAPFSLPASTAQ